STSSEAGTRRQLCPGAPGRPGAAGTRRQLCPAAPGRPGVAGTRGHLCPAAPRRPRAAGTRRQLCPAAPRRRLAASGGSQCRQRAGVCEDRGVKYAEHIVDLVGHTPLVRLNSVTDGIKATVLAKIEYMNPGGSVKDRIAVKMI